MKNCFVNGLFWTVLAVVVLWLVFPKGEIPGRVLKAFTTAKTLEFITIDPDPEHKKGSSVKIHIVFDSIGRCKVAS